MSHTKTEASLQDYFGAPISVYTRRQAIDDGVITESQADLLQEKGFPGRLPGKRGGGMPGKGGFPFAKPAPESGGDQ